MFKSDINLLNDFTVTRNLKPITKKAYATSLKLYTKVNGESFAFLLKEAECEENQKIRWKYRKLKQRLISFRNFLTLNYKRSYAKITLSRIITLYRHFEIEIHDLPPQSAKNHNESPPITYNDLPDREIIKKALSKSDLFMKATILFMLSSGCARRETVNLTVNDLIEATKAYHESTDIYEVIRLLEKENVIPTFRLKRQKTNKYFYTFCSPEATKYIFKYLKTRKNLKGTDKVFNIHPETLNKRFKRLNDSLNFGKAGSYTRFRPHMMRKFHASSLLNDGMSISDINAMQGKTKNMTDESYFFENPEKLKEKYIKHLHALEIYSKKKTIKSPEIIKLERENKQLRQLLYKKECELARIKNEY